MKKMLLAVLMAIVQLRLCAETEVVDGIEWKYEIGGCWASVGSQNWPGFRTVPVSTVGEITIPSSLGGYPVTIIGYNAFADCIGLTGVTIPEGVESIAWYAFAGCAGLERVSIPSSVEFIGWGAFGGCDSLRAFEVSPANPEYKSVNGLLLTKDMSICQYGVNGDVVIPNGVVEIESGAFSGRCGLTSIVIPSSVTSIGGTAFYGCSGLTRVEIPSSVKSIGLWAFGECRGLTSVIIPEGVTNIEGSAFSNCSSLESVTIPSSVANIDCFTSCSSLTNVIISKGVANIDGWAFRWCEGLTSVTIPSSVTNIGPFAFGDCTGLTSVSISDGAMSIGDGAFEYCTSLRSVTIPRSVTSIGDGAFSSYWSERDYIFTGEPIAGCSESAFGSVTPTCWNGFYLSENKSEWLAVIDENGKWKGLTMHCTGVEPRGCDWSTGAIELGWYGVATNLNTITYDVYWSESDDPSSCKNQINHYVGKKTFSPTEIGVQELTINDDQYLAHGDGLKPIYYHVVGTDGSKSFCKTRNRYGIFYGLGKYNKAKFPDLTEKENRGTSASKFAELMLDAGGMESGNAYSRINSDATLHNLTNDFASVSSIVKSGDVFVFFCSTHGGRSTSGQAGVCLYDAYLTNDRLGSLLKEIDGATTGGCRGVALINVIAACHSGGFFEADGAGEWYVDHDLAYCTANAGWISSAGYDTNSHGFEPYPALQTFMLHYGWEKGWAGAGQYVTFGDLARYAKGMVHDLMYDELNTEPQLEPEFGGVLDMVRAGKRGSHSVSIVKPAKPVLTVSQGVSETDMKHRWLKVDDADGYFMFRRRRMQIYYNLTKLFFGAENTEYELKNDVPSNRILPQIYHLKAFNGAGVSTSDEVDGWLKGVVEQIGETAFEYSRTLYGLVLYSISVDNYAAFAPGDIEIPEKIDDCAVVEIARTAFNGNDVVTGVTIPPTVTNIATKAFDGCISLNCVTFKGALPDGVADSGILSHASKIYYPRKYATQYEAVVPAELFAGYTDEEETTHDGSYSEVKDGYTWYYDVKDGEATIVRKNGQGNYVQAVYPSPVGALNIPSKLGGCPVVGIGSYAFNCNLRGSVSIPDSVVTLSGYVFSGTITNLSIGASLRTLSSSAFYYAKVSGITLSPDNENLALRDGVLYSGDLSKLLLVGKDVTTLTIPAEMESDIHMRAFEACPSIKTIEVVDGNTRYDVRNGMLYDMQSDCVVCVPRCAGTVCVIPEGTQIVRAYAAENTDMETLQLPDGLLAVEDYAFRGCAGVTEISIPESVEYIGYEAFYDTGWWNAHVEAAETLAKTTPFVCDGWLLDYWYEEDCDGSVVVPDGVRALADYAFNDSGVTAVTLPCGLDIINDYAFDGCSSLKKIYFSGNAPTQIGMWYRRGECEQYYDILAGTDPEAVCYVRTDASGWTDEDGNLLEYWPLDLDDPEYTDDARPLRYWTWTTPDGSYSETIDGYTWYYDVKDGEATIVAPNTWGWIQVEGDLVIPDTLGGCPVVAIGEGALYNSFVTGGVVIPDSVESIGGYAFYGMITNLSIGASVNAIGSTAFSSAQVKHVALDPANECFELRNGALYTADLTELLLVSSETEELVLPAEMTSPIYRSFAYCPSIASFGVEDGNERYEVRNGLLYDTENDSVVCAPRIGGTCTVPDGTKIIRSSAFARCGYQNVLLPEGLLAIEDIAFSNCTNLEEVTLPESLVCIGYGAFQNTAFLSNAVENAEEKGVTAAIVHDGWLLGYYYGDDFNGKLVVPEGVKALAVLSIADTGLTDLTLPASIDIINEHALNCYSLKAIRFRGDAPTCLGAYCQSGELTYTYDIFSGTDADAVSYVKNDALGWTDDDELPALWPLNPDYPEDTYNARAIRYWTTGVPELTISRDVEGGNCRVVLASETEGATIRYTVDGSDPTDESPTYGGEIAIDVDTTIKAYATSDGLPDSDVAAWEIPAQSGLPLYWSAAVNDGEHPWFETCQPSSAIQSGGAGHDNVSSFEIVTNGSLEVSFSWMVSSEQRWDNLVFYVDDEEVARISGECYWEDFYWSVEDNGQHVLRWSYEKDGSQSDGDDCGRLKDLSITVMDAYDPIPDIGDDPSEDEVYEALAGSADDKLQECITNAVNYNAYRDWAEKIGPQTVKESPNAWVSFALGQDALLETSPTDEDLTVEEFDPSAKAGKFDFTVSVEDVEVGSEASKENLKKVFGLEGATSLTSDSFSSDKVDIEFSEPANGKVKFTAGPKDTSAGTFFMKVKINP